MLASSCRPERSESTKVENAVFPKPEQMQSRMAQNAEGPLVMVHLLKFRAKAEYTDGRSDDISGAEG